MAQTVKVCYFAQLRDQAQRSEESCPIENGDTPARLYARLAEQHGFTLGLNQMRVAINDEFANVDVALSAGDTLVFIPPVAGG